MSDDADWQPTMYQMIFLKLREADRDRFEKCPTDRQFRLEVLIQETLLPQEQLDLPFSLF